MKKRDCCQVWQLLTSLFLVTKACTVISLVTCTTTTSEQSAGRAYHSNYWGFGYWAWVYHGIIAGESDWYGKIDVWIPWIHSNHLLEPQLSKSVWNCDHLTLWTWSHWKGKQTSSRNVFQNTRKQELVRAKKTTTLITPLAATWASNSSHIRNTEHTRP